jgi:RNA polymerase sigma-70 factor (ECF subfamily)
LKLVESLMGAIPPPAEADETERLIRDASQGDAEAMRRLLDRHRERLRRMISLRLDSRLRARVDASDVVQETLADAAAKFCNYARERPLPLYPWLHRLAVERLAAVHRKHRRAEARSVAREQIGGFTWPDSSARLLVERLTATDTTPGHALIRNERRRLLHVALAALAPPDREVLVMRYLEELTFPEIAAILGIGEGAAKMRHLRALKRIRTLMGGENMGSGA